MEPASASPRVLLMGCGGIGGVIAQCLMENGVDLMIVTRNPVIADAINRHGLRVRDRDRIRAARARADPELPAGSGPFDLVLLTTQPPHAVHAARRALPSLAENGRMVCFQNGLCEQHVAPIAGTGRTVGAIVAWGSSMREPGVYERTSQGGFVIGRLDGHSDPHLETIAHLLRPIGPVELTTNLLGARWSKLAINCAISSLGTLSGRRLGEALRHRFVRRLALEVMSEAVAVARKLGIHLEKVSGTIDLDWIALTPEDATGPGSPSLLAKHALLLAVGAKFRRLRSSMLAAIERGREPAVDFLNGEIVRRGDELGVATPINHRLQEAIHAIWRREQRPSLPLLRRLYAESRPDAKAATTTYAA